MTEYDPRNLTGVEVLGKMPKTEKEREEMLTRYETEKAHTEDFALDIKYLYYSFGVIIFACLICMIVFISMLTVDMDQSIHTTVSVIGLTTLSSIILLTGLGIYTTKQLPKKC